MPIFPKPIDLAANYVWTGDHTFDGVVTCNGDFNAVDGSFSGTITTANIVGSAGDKGIEFDANYGYLTSSNQAVNVLRWSGSSFEVYKDMKPRYDSLTNFGSDSSRWLKGYFDDGSFTGNLTSEVGGSMRLFNLGSDGDTDTECLELSASANVFTLEAKKSGAGVVRDFNVKANDGDFSGTLKTGGLKTGISGTFQASITLSDTDHTVLADCTNNNVVVSLPAAAGNDGLQYTIKKVDGSANYCSVTPNGAETIDGQSGLTITGQYESVNLVCYSGEWYLV